MTAPTIDLAGYQDATAALRAQIAAYAGAIWNTADLSDNTVARLQEAFTPTVLAAQVQMANLTSVYIAEETGTSPLPVDEAVVLGTRGVPPEMVYRRPVIQTRSLVSQGAPLGAAFEAGRRRLESLATTDLELAKRRQAIDSMRSAGVTSYRRVVKGQHTCALCLIASTQEYRTESSASADIHPGCDCDFAPLKPGEDLDELLDTERLKNATHAKVKEFTGIEAADGHAVDYRHLLVSHEHGELGTVMGWRGEKFTGPNDIPEHLLQPRARELVERVQDNEPITFTRTPGGRGAPTFVGGDSRRGGTAAQRAASDRELEDLLASIGDV